MKNILILVSLVLGVLIPILATTKEFYYLLAVLVVAFTIIVFRKRPLSLVDLLALFILTIPLHSFRFGRENFFIRLSEIVFIPLFIAWVISCLMNKERRPWLIRKEFIFLISFLLINILSTKNSMYPGISWEKIFILAYLFLFTYIVSNIIDKQEKLNSTVNAMLIISSLASILAAFQSIFPQFLFFEKVTMGKFLGTTFYRAGAGWHDPNYFAIYVGMNAALTFACVLSFKKNSFYKICFLLQVLGIIATFSRTISFSLILVCLYLLNYFKRTKLALMLLTTVVITGAIITTSIFVIYKKNTFLATVFYRVSDKEKIRTEPTLIMGHRAAAFIANWHMFQKHPILGVGPFMAMYNFYKYRPSGFESPPRSWFASHNQYLQLLSEKGIFGFFIFIGFILLILKHINRAIKEHPEAKEKTYLIGLKAAIFLYLLASLTLESTYELQFWLTIGITLAIFNIIKNEGCA